MIAELDGGTIGGAKAAAADVRESAPRPASNEPFMATGERLPWETRRFLTAAGRFDVEARVWRLAATVRAWSDIETNCSQLVWCGDVEGFEALGRVAEAFSVPAAHVYVESGRNIFSAGAYCAARGWTYFNASRKWSFRHREGNGFSLRVYSERYAARSRLADRRNSAEAVAAIKPFSFQVVEWSVPAQSGNLRHTIECGGHRWLFPAKAPGGYLKLIDAAMKTMGTVRAGDFYRSATMDETGAFGPWMAECMQLAAAEIAGCVAVWFRPAPRFKETYGRAISMGSPEHKALENWYRTADHAGALEWIRARLDDPDRRALAAYLRRKKGETHIAQPWIAVCWAAARLSDHSNREFSVRFADYLTGQVMA